MADLTDRAFESVARHFVSLSCLEHVPGRSQPHALVFSGFLIEIERIWLHITAGHVARRVRAAVDAGASFDHWRFYDQAARNRYRGMAVPVHIDIDRWLVVEDTDTGLDYAAIVIDGITKLALEQGGSTPLGKMAWGNQLTPYDHWALVGIPKETVAYDGKALISARMVFAPLRPAEEPPAAGDKARNQFYAQLLPDLSNQISDIDGMSGGPVFSFADGDGHGNWKYGVIGVQSGWYRSTRTIAACPFSSFALELEKLVRDALALKPEGAA